MIDDKVSGKREACVPKPPLETHPMPIPSPDPLRTASGLIFGLVLGVLAWIVLILAWRWLG